jgi:hypothetical protein
MLKAASEIEIICPKCGNISDKGNFKSQVCYANPSKGVWNCYRCASKGRVANLPEDVRASLGFDGSASSSQSNGRDSERPEARLSRELWGELVEAYQEELLGGSRLGLDYLAGRLGLAEDFDRLGEAIRAFKLGFDSGRQMIVIPVYKAQRLVGIKYRKIESLEAGLNGSTEVSFAGPKYLAEAGTESGVYELEGDPSRLLICEGELDAISARLMGFDGRILATQTNRIQSQVRNYYEQAIENANKVIVSLDKDDAGLELGRVLPEMIPLSKLAQLELPKNFHDINEILESGSLDNQSVFFQQYIKEAKTGMEQLTYSVLDKIRDSINFLENRRNVVGWSTGFPLLDDKLGGGLLPYTLTAISAPGKTGKTTFTIQLIHNLLRSNVKVGFMSLEMNPSTHVIPSLLSIVSGTNIRKLEGTKLEDTVNKAIDGFNNLSNLYFMDRYGSTPADMLKDWITYQYKTNNVEVFFLDHVGYSLADIKDSNEHSRLSKMLRSLTRELPIHIVAIVQPRNLQFGQTKVTKSDLYGSITWSQDLNALITLERLGDGGLAVRLTDSHNPLSKPGDDSIILYYDWETCSLS